MPRRTTPFTALIAFAALASAKKIGFFESSSCPDPQGFESCYKTADETWAACVSDNCADQDTDCVNLCTCIQNLDKLDCAGQSCWNQVYSCAYQETVGELTSSCLDPKYDRVPFWPPPDDADAGCSCNFGKIVTTQARAIDELQNTCGVELLGTSNPGNDEFQEVAAACQCCSSSAILSAIWNICPSTDPALIGATEWTEAIGILDKNWEQCSAFIEEYPCENTLGMSPPAGDKSNDFYVHGDFPANGTQTLYNTGTISSPVSGATYTYSYFDGAPRVVTVASANARPTASSGSPDSSSSDSDRGEDKSNSTGDNEVSSPGASDIESDDSSAGSLSPWLLLATWPLAGTAMVLVWL